MSKTSKFTGKSGSRIEDWYGESGIEDRFKKLENTLGGRDFSGAVSCFCQVFMVTRFAARGFGLRPKMCRALADTENSRRTRGKPLVPREIWARNCR